MNIEPGSCFWSPTAPALVYIAVCAMHTGARETGNCNQYLKEGTARQSEGPPKQEGDTSQQEESTLEKNGRSH